MMNHLCKILIAALQLTGLVYFAAAIWQAVLY